MRAIRFLSALVMFTTLAAIACSAIGAEPVDFGKLWGKPEIKSGKAETLAIMRSHVPENRTRPRLDGASR